MSPVMGGHFGALSDQMMAMDYSGSWDAVGPIVASAGNGDKILENFNSRIGQMESGKKIADQWIENRMEELTPYVWSTSSLRSAK